MARARKPKTAQDTRESEAAKASGVSPDAGEDTAATLETAVPTLTHLRVTAKHDGFRRCGRAWPASGVEVSAEDFTDTEIERLVTEPELVVVPVFGPAREID